VKKSEGFVSLITAIMLSLLLLAITISLISLQVVTLRKAEDSEQSQVAYFAAESGIEDAVAKVKTGTVGAAGQACPGGASANTNLVTTPGLVGWTCQSITLSGAQSDDLKQPDSAITIDPYNAAGGGFSSVTVLWDQSVGNAAAYYNAPLSGGLVNFAGGATTWNGHAIPLELTVVSYPTGAFTGGQINTQNALIAPRSGGGGTIAYSQRATYTNGSAGKCGSAVIGGNPGACGLDANNPYNANCNNNFTDPSGLTSGVYHCKITINGLSAASNYLFRVQSRFMGDNGTGNGRFVMYFSNGGGLVNVTNSTATIDVTGKAGDVYRRVVYKLPINSVANSGLNNALFSEAGLCQNYQILGGAKNPPGACP